MGILKAGSIGSGPMSMVGKFQVLKRIASGGMAELFLARERGFSGIDKFVVLKRVLPQHLGNGDFLRMFRDEARISSMLQHPNLVQMFELGSIEGMEFISMEYLHGEDVRSVYRALRERGQSFSLDVAFSIAIGVAAGLHYAHTRRALDGTALNIVHRDISPANVVVTYEGGVKLVDFGIARFENRAHQTSAAVMKGKIPYMAPEQVLGLAVDARTDVYSLGVLLFEMTTGQRPFRHDSDIRLMRAIAEDAVVSPKTLIPGYPAALAQLVLTALAKDPGARFQTAQAFQAALEEFARKMGLSLSSIGVSKYMHDLFGERANTYAKVLAGLASTDALPVEGLGEEFAPSSANEPPAENVPTSASQAALPVAHENATFSRVGPVTVLCLHGRLTEKFAGAEIGRALRGPVVIDCSRVERITSYGVREWLQMLGAAESKVSGLYLARCSEAVMNQLSTIRSFVGSGHVVSFLAPYVCRACRHAFTADIDVATHAALLTQRQVPSVPCEKCHADADFDDDPKSYLAFGPKAVSLSPEIAAAFSTLTPTASTSEDVEKIIEGAVTRLQIRSLESPVRWARVLDGVEGELRVVFDADARVNTEGARSMAAAFGGLGSDVKAVSVEAAPNVVYAALSNVNWVSVRVDGRCRTCNTARGVIVPHALFSSGAPLAAACRRCNSPLEVSQQRVVAPKRTPPWLAVALAAVALVVVAGAFTTRASRTEAPEASAPLSQFEPTTSAPGWADAAPTHSGSQLIAVGFGGPSEPAGALEAARIDALRRISRAMGDGLDGPTRAVLKSLDGASDDATVARRLGLSLELISAVQRGTGTATELWARFAVSEEAASAAQIRMTSTREVGGGTFIAVPAHVGGDALLVVHVSEGPALAAGLRVGDMVTEANGAPMTDLAALAAVVDTHQPITFKTVAAGVVRTARLVQ